jgi:hypothetical protein
MPEVLLINIRRNNLEWQIEHAQQVRAPRRL